MECLPTRPERHSRHVVSAAASGVSANVRRTASIGFRVWRSTPNPSPALIDRSFYDHQTPTGNQPVGGCLPTSKLELYDTAASPSQASRWHVCCHFEHTQCSRQKDNVDVAAHAEGVDAAKRIAQQKTLAGLDRGATNQSSHSAETETASRLDGRDEDRARVVVAELNHVGTVAQPPPPRTRRRRRDHGGLHTSRPTVRAHSIRQPPLRYAPVVDCADFHSGDDMTLAFLGCTYAFARADFEQRVLRAAVELELATRPLSRSAQADLVAAAIDGELTVPRSPTGELLVDLCGRDGEDPIYWLRKLVFRSAWLDHRIKHGLVEIEFDESVGAFRIEPGRYPLPGAGHPSFAALTVPEDRA